MRKTRTAFVTAIILLATVGMATWLCWPANPPAQPKMLVSGEVCRDTWSYTTTDAPRPSPVQYEVTFFAKNVDKALVTFDQVIATFSPAAGQDMNITITNKEGLTEDEITAGKSVPWALQPGEVLTARAATNGYTFKLLRDTDKRPLAFELLFLDTGRTVAGPFRAELPHINDLPKRQLIEGEGPPPRLLSFDPSVG
jgi:hypothetical protein